MRPSAIIALLLIAALSNPLCCCTAAALLPQPQAPAPSCCGLPPPTGSQSEEHDPDNCPHKGGDMFRQASIDNVQAAWSLAAVLPDFSIDRVPWEPAVVAGAQRAALPHPSASTAAGPPGPRTTLYCSLLL